MALAHLLTDGTETGLTAATKINNGLTQNDTNLGDIGALDLRVLDVETPDTVDFTPLVTPPTYQEGRIFYDDNNGVLRVNGEYSDVDVAVARHLQLKVINNTGVTIIKGSAVRHDGVLGGYVKVEKALADTFENARVLGVTAHDIVNGAQGIITTAGVLSDLDTTSLTAGVPLYLSDTVAGTYTTVAPPIATRIGGVLETSLTGRLVVAIINNMVLPQFGAFFQNTTVPLDFNNNLGVFQEFNDFLFSQNLLINISSGNSFLIPLAGTYRGSFTVSMSNITANVNGHIIDIELYDKSIGNTLFVYKMIVGKSETVSSCSFSAPTLLSVGNEIVMRYKSSTAVGSAVVVDGVSMSIESRNVR